MHCLSFAFDGESLSRMHGLSLRLAYQNRSDWLAARQSSCTILPSHDCWCTCVCVIWVNIRGWIWRLDPALCSNWPTKREGWSLDMSIRLRTPTCGMFSDSRQVHFQVFLPSLSAHRTRSRYNCCSKLRRGKLAYFQEVHMTPIESNIIDHGWKIDMVVKIIHLIDLIWFILYLTRQVS